ncbi:MAG: alpha-1,4 polygalactosaminidase [Kouleothrix sp.]|nr:alpha-1,4 polygalactosaminidase [Kouleothrix sp.]
MALSTTNAQVIDILKPKSSAPGLWSPNVGPETVGLLKHLDLPDDESRKLVRDQALSVLSRCVSPQDLGGHQTGLVVGYVQSGKTMSFTTVTALALDNGFPIIIVIAGTSKPLFWQSEKRLKDDLRLNDRDDHKWKHFSNPKTNARASIESALAEWRDPAVSVNARQTVLITVMKNHTHLRHLNALLKVLSLKDVPILVVDDEADQAGLNASVNKGELSTTYRCLVELRQLLPHHTFLQYTATPQAPLLINLIDVLSPRFAEVLEPGKAYTGGKEFFAGHLKLARTIPDADIPTKDHPLTSPPESLLLAMRLFYLGVAAGYVHSEQPKGNRSMMVHPSQKTVPHMVYYNWVNQAQKQWVAILQQGKNNPDRKDLLAEFKEAYDDLCTAVPNIPSFDALADKLSRAVRNTHVIEVNSKQVTGTPEINWKNDYAHILVGGQAMDRGFTVEGLTVTYMPRTTGVGNADTVQQRARFFGYKMGYLGYCRVFIEDSAHKAFKAYVDHEEHIRKQLKEHRASAKPLTEWKRAFFLEPNLRPTRASVLDMPYIRDNYSDSWFRPTAPHDAPDATETNRTIVEDFLADLVLVPDEGHKARTETQRHTVASDVPLADVFSKLLLPLRMTRPNDSQHFTGLLLQVQQYFDKHPNAVCTVYHMSGGRERERSVDNQDKVKNLFQGAHPDKSGAIYRGDQYIRNNEQLTIQIHNLQVQTPDGNFSNVPAIAVWVPREMSKAWLSQNQGAS